MRPSRTPTSTPAQRNRCSCERRATPSSSPPRRRHGSCGRRRRRYSGGGEQQNIAAAAPGHESPSPPTNPRQQCQTPIVVTVIQEPKITDLYLDAQGNTNQIQRFKDMLEKTIHVLDPMVGTHGPSEDSGKSSSRLKFMMPSSPVSMSSMLVGHPSGTVGLQCFQNSWTLSSQVTIFNI